MPKAYFVVRSVVEPPLRQRFDRWYSEHHLPMALAEFKCEKCWRFWSAHEAGVHYAAYQFADMARLDAALGSDGFKMLVADFDAAWPHGVSRTRDRVEMVEERVGEPFRLQPIAIRRTPGHDSHHSSPPGLTRWSMLNCRTGGAAAWIAGSSPAMTAERIFAQPGIH